MPTAVEESPAPQEDWDAPSKAAPATESAAEPAAEVPPSEPAAEVPPSEPSAEAVGREITFGDVIQPDRNGNVCLTTIARDLGLSCSELNARKWGVRVMNGDHKWVSAAAVLGWIQREGIRCTISDEARAAALKRKKQADESPEPAPEKKPDLLGAVADVTQLIQQQTTEESEYHQQKYCNILHRYHEPREDDAEQLVFLLEQLDLSPRQVREDLRILQRVTELRTLHEGQEKAAEARRAAHVAYKKLRKRHEQEELDADKLMRSTERDSAAAGAAAADATTLASNRPLLFDGTDENSFPKLRRPSDLKS